MHEPMGDPSALTRVNVGLGITMTFLVLAVQVRPCSGIFLRNVSTNRYNSDKLKSICRKLNHVKS